MSSDLWVWNGSTEVPANVTVWNGTSEVAANVSVHGFTPTAPQVVSSATGNGTASVIVPVPSGVVSGDLLVTFLVNQSSAITADYTAPSGWARAGWPFVASEAGKRFNAAYTHVATGSEPASYTWVNAVTGSRAVGICVAVRGAKASSPVIAYRDPQTETDASLPKIPTATVPADLSLVLAMCHTVNGAGVNGTPTFGAPWTQVAVGSQPNPISGAANDVLWVGRTEANTGSVGGQVGSVVSGVPGADACAVLVIGR